MKRVNNFFEVYEEQLYADATWFLIKLIWAFSFCKILIEKLFEIKGIASPIGICNFLPCSFLNLFEVKIIVSIALVILSVFYVLEKQMVFVLFTLSLFSIAICSTIDSSGVLFRLAGFSLIYIVQFIAYLLNHRKPKTHNLSKLRIHFSLQIIASLYTLSFTSKLISSGLFWFTQTAGFGSHVLKSWLYSYVSTGNEQILNKGYFFHNFIDSHPYLIGFALSLAMVLEGFAFLTLFNSKRAFFWGLALIGMHTGIYVLMDIKIYSIILPMLLFMLNLPAVVITIFTLVKEGRISDLKQVVDEK